MVLLYKDQRDLVGFEVTLYNVIGSLHEVTGVFKKLI